MTADLDIPPIVLLVDTHPESLEAYSQSFEQAGLWVAATRAPDEVVASATELHPDLIITDADGESAAASLDAIDTLKSLPDLRDVPVIALVSQSAAAPSGADVTLRKPVPTEFLLRRAREVLARARELRAQSNGVISRSRAVTQRSQRILNAAMATTEELDAVRRPCPGCSHPLEWVERGSIGGISYDYYRWCAKGCGLYCYNRSTLMWIKLS